jgi:hypothetical protein
VVSHCRGVVCCALSHRRRFPHRSGKRGVSLVQLSFITST